MGFPLKYNEFIESANIASHVRPRSASAAIGPNGPESAAMVCAMQVRAGKNVKPSHHERASPSDATRPGLHTQQEFTSSNLVSVQNLCDGSVVSKSHGKCWFDTDSEASDSSDMDVPILVHGCDSVTSYTAGNHDLIASNPGNGSKSPPCTQHGTVRDQESSSNFGFSSSDIHFQEFGSIFSVQHSDHNDVVNSPNIHAFSREAFAPKVMPWFKAKRKATNKGNL